MSDDAEKKVEKVALAAGSEIVQAAAQFVENSKQNEWIKATSDYRSTQKDTVSKEGLSDKQIADIQARGGFSKFQIVDESQLTARNTGSSSLSDKAPILIAQVHRLDEQRLDEALKDIPERTKERGSNPFKDTGKTLEPLDAHSWTLPTTDNCKCWMPGDPINPFTWADDSSKYVQEVMKQNFVFDSDGNRVSVFDLKDAEFKFRFGNAVRHAIGTGTLMHLYGLSPGNALAFMESHEYPAMLANTARPFLGASPQEIKKHSDDIDSDIHNNKFAAHRAFAYKNYRSFERQMLCDAWFSASIGSWKLEDSKLPTQYK